MFEAISFQSCHIGLKSDLLNYKELGIRIAISDERFFTSWLTALNVGEWARGSEGQSRGLW